MRKILFRLLVVAGLLATYSSVSAQVGLHAKIISVRGDVKVKTSFIGLWKNAEADMALQVEDMLKTASDGYAEISLSEEDKDIFKIESDTTIKIKIMGEKLKVLDLPKGSVYGYVSDLNRGTAFEVRTPTATAGARGTAWLTWTDGENYKFSTFERNIYVQSLDKKGGIIKQVTVGEGFSVSFGKYQPPGAFTKVSDADMGKWKSWQGDFMNRLPYFKEMQGRIPQIKSPDQYRQDQRQQMEDFKSRYRYEQGDRYRYDQRKY